MSTFQKYNQTVEDLGRGVHNLNTGTIKIALSNTAPNASTHKVLADITEIAPGNGYSAGGATVGATSYAQSAGVGKLAGNDVTITASGGSIATFRYVILYNSTPSGGPLLGFWDYGSTVVITSGNSFVTDFADNTDLLDLT